jgi:broad specificity phosphatase PhoE
VSETIIGLLRHGQTDWNVDFRLQGITDIPLNANGIQQAQEAAEILIGSDWDVLLSSPLSRAQETAKLISKNLNLDEIIIEPLLLERSFGVAEGLTHEQWRESYANLNELPGGESLDALRIRAEELLHHLQTNYRGKKVLAVTHGALIRKLLRLASNQELPREGERLSNASLSTLVHDDINGWRVLDYNPATFSG